MMTILSNVLKFVFPKLCLHCKEVLTDSALVCKGCGHAFELLDPQACCPFCFSEKGGGSPCLTCIQNKASIKLAAACPLFDPVSTMVNNLKNGKIPYLAKTAASLMAMQLTRLDWPSFDALVPIPKRIWFQNDNHAELIAKCLGKLLKIEVIHSLARSFGELPRSRIRTPEMIQFFLKKRNRLKGKNVLLVDDVIYTGKTLRNAAYVLKEESPHVYGLAFARAI